MIRKQALLGTGLPKLDQIFHGLMAGDNVVWQVGGLADFTPFVDAYIRFAAGNRRKVIYFRYAAHPPLAEASDSVEIFELSPEDGFESFVWRLYDIIDTKDRGSMYLFDALSPLATVWRSDRVMGNFFQLLCPHLYDRGSIAYFAIFRDQHSYHAVRPISETTQIMVDVFRHDGELFIHPTKVQHRHSPRMYMLHKMAGEDFIPVTRSALITETLREISWSRLDVANSRRGYWNRTFLEAEAVRANLDTGEGGIAAAAACFRELSEMLISDEDAVLALAERYFTLDDLLSIHRRMIGTGRIGGKAVGMLLARAVLRSADDRWSGVVEPHDSFFVGTDVFDTYLIHNDCWLLTQCNKRRGASGMADATEAIRRRVLAGEFPEYIMTQFADMLNYFGQYPIIVRSSSLLEDSFGNAFAGKYESVFCANQGGHHRRMEDFINAVRTVYASIMSDEALDYRAKRGLIDRDEQMGLLIQRVSGSSNGNYFYPHAAGVSFSFNPYVWDEAIDSEAGMARVVFGVGTRAVDRSDDDYTRVVALNAPDKRPEANFDQVKHYAQRRVDVIDFEMNALVSESFEAVASKAEDIPLDMFASKDRILERNLRGIRGARFAVAESGMVLTFDKLLMETTFVADMREMLETLRDAYSTHVDLEFTLNFINDTEYRIGIVQCRPFQVHCDTGGGGEKPRDIADDDLVMRSKGAVVGCGAYLDVDWIIYVVPSVYSVMGEADRHAVADLIGELAHHPSVKDGVTMLMGPGRWGSTTPALGVPVSFMNITPVSVICEMVMMRENLVPDVSLGTHFFNELVENNMRYLAFFPDRDGNYLNTGLLEAEASNFLTELLPKRGELSACVRIMSAADIAPDRHLSLFVDPLKSEAVCFKRG